MTRIARLRMRAPIGLQLVALLLVSLLAAQAITFLMLSRLPMPRPQVYRTSEIAAALRGSAAAPRTGRPLIRTAEAGLPAELAHTRPGGFGRDNPEMLSHALATELGVTPADVRIDAREEHWLFEPRHRLDHIHKGPAWAGGHPPGPPPDGPTGPGGPGGPGPRLWIQQGPGGDGRFFIGFRAPADMPVFGNVTAALRSPGGGWIVVRSAPEPFPTEWQKRMLLWFLSGFLLVAPAGLLFARRITAPLKRFAEAADRLGRDPRAPPLTLSGPAEIGMAARAFNDMQARLRRYVDDRTGMVGAISHDLRTPLARIRFKMERASPELRASVLADVAQMEQMIGDVLAFIRDEGQPRQRERLDLLSLVECVADDAAMLGGDVEIAASMPLMVDGDPVGLQRLFANLVDNAVKYGRGARISMAHEGASAVVTITDFGPGLAVEELEKVFQPFYRADASRNLDKGGVGLGLPIARATARAHGGDVELASGGSGAVARVSLPLAT